MMKNQKQIKLTVEEGLPIFQLSCDFAMPEKLGSQTFSIADRSIAGDEVHELWRELRRHSPIHQSKKRIKLFGPENAWEPFTDASGAPGHRMVEPDLEVTLFLNTVDPSALNGLYWVLLSLMHPQSQAQQGAAKRGMLWDIARRIGKFTALREDCEFDKSKPKAIKNDLIPADDKPEGNGSPVEEISSKAE